MLQDTAAGGAFLAHERQAELRSTASRARHGAGIIAWLRRTPRPSRGATVTPSTAAAPSTGATVVQPQPA